jgi:hypothetical protein
MWRSGSLSATTWSCSTRRSSAGCWRAPAPAPRPPARRAASSASAAASRSIVTCLSHSSQGWWVPMKNCSASTTARRRVCLVQSRHQSVPRHSRANSSSSRTPSRSTCGAETRGDPDCPRIRWQGQGAGSADVTRPLVSRRGISAKPVPKTTATFLVPSRRAANSSVVRPAGATSSTVYQPLRTSSSRLPSPVCRTDRYLIPTELRQMLPGCRRRL